MEPQDDDPEQYNPRRRGWRWPFSRKRKDDFVARLGEALLDADLDEDAVAAITRAVRQRRRRRLILRISAGIGLVAMAAAFYLGFTSGGKKPEPVAPVTPSTEAPVPPATTTTITESPTTSTTTTTIETASASPSAARIEIVSTTTSSTLPKREAASPVVPETVPAKGKTYAVEVGGAMDHAEAERLFKRLRREGYSVTLDRLAGPRGREEYRVRVGHFPTAKKANGFAAVLRRNEGLEGKIVSRPE